MSSSAQNRGARKGLRDAFQAVLAVVAAGGATAVIELAVGSVDPAYSALMAFAFKIAIAYAQNYLETAGRIPVLLPSAAVVPVAKAIGPLVAPVAGVVEAVVDATGQVTGTVTDITGDVVGGVTGIVGGLLDPEPEDFDTEGGNP